MVSILLSVHPGRVQTWALLQMLTGPAPTADASPAQNSTELQSVGSLASNLRSDGPTESGSPPGSFVSPAEPIPASAHIAITAVFLALSALVAVLVPSASDLMGVVGGFACVTYVLVLPAEIARKLRAEHAAAAASGPAPFLDGPRGLLVIVGLWACALCGYLAAGQSAWRIVTGT